MLYLFLQCRFSQYNSHFLNRFQLKVRTHWMAFLKQVFLLRKRILREILLQFKKDLKQLIVHSTFAKRP